MPTFGGRLATAASDRADHPPACLTARAACARRSSARCHCQPFDSEGRGDRAPTTRLWPRRHGVDRHRVVPAMRVGSRGQPWFLRDRAHAVGGGPRHRPRGRRPFAQLWSGTDQRVRPHRGAGRPWHESEDPAHRRRIVPCARTAARSTWCANDCPPTTSPPPRVQDINTRHLMPRARRIVGCRSASRRSRVQKQLGVDQPDFGMLFRRHGLGADGEDVSGRACTSPSARPRSRSCSSTTSTAKGSRWPT